jgi:hypothetical protein
MSLARWRGVVALTKDALVHGSRAIERVQLEVAARPFTILARIPPISAPTRLVHVLHDASVKTTHAIVRAVGTAVARSADVVLEQVEARSDDA